MPIQPGGESPTGIVSVLAVVPRAPEHSTLIIEWHCARERPTPAELAVIDYLHDTVRSEDSAIVESVQRGARLPGQSPSRMRASSLSDRTRAGPRHSAFGPATINAAAGEPACRSASSKG